MKKPNNWTVIKVQQLSKRAVYDPAIKQWLCDFLDIWIGDSDKVLKKAA